MNFKTTIVLLVVLLAVGAGLYFTRDKGNQTETVTAPEKLLSVSSADISRLSITGDDGKKMVLERDGANWRLSEPVKAPAEATTASSLIDTLTSMQTRGKVEPAGTGLDSPRWTIEIATKENKAVKLDVGSRSAAGDNLYVRVDGQSKADVVPTELSDQLEKPLKQWRREKLFDLSATEIKQVKIASTQPTLELQKTGEKWSIAQPSNMPADTSSASDVAMAAANLRAVEFVSDQSADMKRYGLDQPTLSVSFSAQAPPPPPPATQPTTKPTFTTINFGRFDDVMKKNVYASVSGDPSVFKVAVTSLDEFKKSPLEIRDKAIVSVEPDKVTKISITTDKPATTQPTTKPAENKTVVLERAKQVTAAMGAPAPASAPSTSPSSAPSTTPSTTQASTQPARQSSKWVLASKEGAEAEDSKVDTLLSEFHPLRVDKYLETSTSTTQPAATYTITIETTDARHELRFTDQGSAKPAIGQYNGLTFELSRWLLDKLQGDFVRGESITTSPPSPMMPPE